MIGMNKKVWITKDRKTDGEYNKGKVVGIKKIYEGLGFYTESQYLNGFIEYEYLVAFVDTSTKRGYAEWVYYEDLSLKKPEE